MRTAHSGKMAASAGAGACGRPVLVLMALQLLLWSTTSSRAERSLVKVITDHNWREMLQGEWMVEFYAPWCPACQQLQAEWNAFAEWSDDLGVNVAKVDVTEQPGLSGRFIITALPTIYHCKDGEFRKYQGPRMKNDFIDFIDGKKWESIEPMYSWLQPSSFLMTSMSALFQLSMWIRHCHNYFTEDIGIPVWGSYTIFALMTLFSGLVLGLILVFVADYVLPSRRYKHQPHCSERKMPGSKLLQSKDGHLQDEANEDDHCSHERKSSSKRLEKTLVKDDGDHIQDTVRKRTLEYTSRTDDS
ncbi:thioredoxin-related transmembrane protein 1-like [Leucoraja erinacea]|uniref:thioredoxin-related transmembrane protein 1-like n=1 Tax=Leucoraja erinaceus TaxID=7782 RepID=UPI00245672C6|nr:thioredoxin-related transmembrane protein 1-like [Leucoraja erinacea]XP_055496372.1 thioredoxin-related transmembrane protein 1-like [Leucoraja erinacea]